MTEPHRDPFRKGYSTEAFAMPEGGWPMDAGFVQDVRAYLHWFTRVDELSYEVRAYPGSQDGWWQARCLDVFSVATGNNQGDALKNCKARIKSTLYSDIRMFMLDTFSAGRDGRLKPSIVGWLDDLYTPENRKYAIEPANNKGYYRVRPNPPGLLQTECTGVAKDVEEALQRSYEQVQAEAVIALTKYVDAMALIYNNPAPFDRPTNAVIIPCTAEACAWPVRRGEWGEES